MFMMKYAHFLVPVVVGMLGTMGPDVGHFFHDFGVYLLSLTCNRYRIQLVDC